MILPNKHITLEFSLLGVGAFLLLNLDHAYTVSTLWNKVRAEPTVGSFTRFTLALDLLFMLGAIEFNDGKLRRVK